MAAIYGLVEDKNANSLEQLGSRLMHRGDTTLHFVVDSRIKLGGRFQGHYSQNLASDQFVLVADAAIYNAAELRKMLSDHGHTFETDQDEEVILKGYIEFGPKFCEYLIGDFAFALWDATRAILLLARDPLGSRPLYYWKEKDLFVFASEYKALLSLTVVPVEADLEAIQLLQYTKYPPPNRTLIKNIFSIPAGHFVEYSLSGNLQEQRYWDVKIDLTTVSETEQIQSVRKQFLRTIDRQLGTLTEVGVTLSGGVDSAAIAAAVRKLRPDITLHTFTCGHGPDDPEIQMAQIIADTIDAIHHPIYFKPKDIPDILPHVIWHLEDPIARSETVLTFETSKVAAEYVDVVIAGHAADGLYGGMPRHKLVRLIEWLPVFRKPLEEFYNYTQSGARPSSAAGKLLLYSYFKGNVSNPLRVKGVSFPPPESMLPAGCDDLLNEVLRSGVMTGVTKWLPKIDRLHFAHGLNYRSPFTDVELIRNAFQISGKTKMKRLKEKFIFREAVKPLLPSVVLNRPKFPQAMKYDLALTEVLEDISLNVLSSSAVESRGFFDISDINTLRQRPPNKPYNSEQAMRLWTAILTELWAVEFLDKKGCGFSETEL